MRSRNQWPGLTKGSGIGYGLAGSTVARCSHVLAFNRGPLLMFGSLRGAQDACGYLGSCTTHQAQALNAGCCPNPCAKQVAMYTSSRPSFDNRNGSWTHHEINTYAPTYTYLSTYLPIYLSTDLPYAYLPAYVWTYARTHVRTAISRLGSRSPEMPLSDLCCQSAICRTEKRT